VNGTEWPYIAGLEQERISCVLVETEKIEKQTLHNCNKSPNSPIEMMSGSFYKQFISRLNG